MPQTAAYAGTSATFVDEATNKQLFWTVNKRILACMLGTYFCQSLDKGTLGFASIMGIKNDAHLVGQQFRLVAWSLVQKSIDQLPVQLARYNSLHGSTLRRVPYQCPPPETPCRQIPCNKRVSLGHRYRLFSSCQGFQGFDGGSFLARCLRILCSANIHHHVSLLLALL